MKILKEGQTVTLINWGNVIITSIERCHFIFVVDIFSFVLLDHLLEQLPW